MGTHRFWLWWSDEDAKDQIQDVLDNIDIDDEDEDSVVFDERGAFRDTLLSYLSDESDHIQFFKLSMGDDELDEERFVVSRDSILFTHSLWMTRNGELFDFTVVGADGRSKEVFFAKVGGCVFNGHRRATVWFKPHDSWDLPSDAALSPEAGLAVIFEGFGEVDGIGEGSGADGYDVYAEYPRHGGWDGLLAYLKNFYDSPGEMLEAVFKGGYTERFAKSMAEAWKSTEAAEIEKAVRGFGLLEDMIPTQDGWTEDSDLDEEFFCGSYQSFVEHGGSLQAVPDEEKTPGLCLAAVQIEPDAMEYVPEDLETEVAALASLDED